jgi:hypothetical protein
MTWYDQLAAVGVEGLVVKPLGGVYGGPRWVKVRRSHTTDAEALALVGPPNHPDALVVQLPDGATATTSPTLDIIQAGEVATAAGTVVEGVKRRRGGVYPLAKPLTVEVRVITGRHSAVRFVRVRGD